MSHLITSLKNNQLALFHYNMFDYDVFDSDNGKT